jgi:hypothetical protein
VDAETKKGLIEGFKASVLFLGVYFFVWSRPAQKPSLDADGLADVGASFHKLLFLLRSRGRFGENRESQS